MQRDVWEGRMSRPTALAAAEVLWGVIKLALLRGFFLSAGDTPGGIVLPDLEVCLSEKGVLHLAAIPLPGSNRVEYPCEMHNRVCVYPENRQRFLNRGIY